MVIDEITLERNNFPLKTGEVWARLEIHPFERRQEYFISSLGRVSRNQYFSQQLEKSLPWVCELAYTNVNHAGDPIINAYLPNFGPTTISLKKAVFLTFCDGSQGKGPRIENTNKNRLDCRRGNLRAYCPTESSRKRREITTYLKQISQYELDTLYDELINK